MILKLCNLLTVVPITDSLPMKSKALSSWFFRKWC